MTDDQPAASTPDPAVGGAAGGPAAGGRPPSRTVVILPPLKEAAMLRILRMLRTGGWLIPQTGCLLLVLEPDPASDPDRSQQITATISKAMRRAQLLQVRLSGGYLAFSRWQRGALYDEPTPGLLAQSLPDPVLGLVHGSTDPASLSGARPVESTAPGAEGGSSGLLGRLFGR